MENVTQESVISTLQLMVSELVSHNELLVLILAPTLIFSTIALAFFTVYRLKRIRSALLESKHLEDDGESKADSQDTLSASHLPEEIDPRGQVKPVEADASLSKGLEKTRQRWFESLGGLFRTRSVLSDEVIERIHEILYRADLGVRMTDLMLARLRLKLKGQNVDWPQIKGVLEELLCETFDQSAPENAEDFDFNSLPKSENGPTVLMVVGVNGAGKTTSIGKLAARAKSQGKTVLIAAADTFRAAAIDQLKVWGDRVALTGSVVTETIFDWPGLGSLLLEAISSRDYPIIQGCVLYFSLSFLSINLLTDVLYGWLDPRIRVASK